MKNHGKVFHVINLLYFSIMLLFQLNVLSLSQLM